MMFNRARLVALCEGAMRKHREVFDTNLAKKLEEQESKKREWMVRYEPVLRGFASEIVIKLDRGEPIMEKDIPRNHRGFAGSVPTWVPERIDRDYTPPRELGRLLEILKASDDEKVSSSGLKDLGYVNLNRIIPNISTALD